MKQEGATKGNGEFLQLMYRYINVQMDGTDGWRLRQFWSPSSGQITNYLMYLR